MASPYPGARVHIWVCLICVVVTSSNAAAILFFSRDICSNSSAKLFRACFDGVLHNYLARYVAKWGITQMCLCKTKYQVGVSHHFGGLLTSLEKYRTTWGAVQIWVCLEELIDKQVVISILALTPGSGVAPANQTKVQNKSSMRILLVFLRKNPRTHKNGRYS